ncbi:DUF3467 domain-containing protein [Natronoglycomyces albus]|uniref:DUF3467 domain-containing protein n=1 Tax=Natronoglycomyces albus TaxID=2811108 RepID=A0A895XQG5_9ACTN|nr:DUF3467 domain-containing protein [Natronoglycomyces albus]QSB05385.1 DUF3467 domain-containing protein [Natronoglycomyces albus]
MTSSSPSPRKPERRVSIDTPAEIETGKYANFVAIWHDPDSFTLDFATLTGPAQPISDPNTENTVMKQRAKVVSRVKIPPSQVFELMKALEQQLSAWEKETGRGSRPPAE